VLPDEIKQRVDAAAHQTLRMEPDIVPFMGVQCMQISCEDWQFLMPMAGANWAAFRIYRPEQDDFDYFAITDIEDATYIVEKLVPPDPSTN
jgi:hypothetical protein